MGGVLIFGDRRSNVGFEGTVRGDRSTEALVLCSGDGESVSDLVTPRASLLTLGVAGDVLLIVVFVVRGVSEEEDLSDFTTSSVILTILYIKKHISIHSYASTKG